MYYVKVRYFFAMLLLVTTLSLNIPFAHAEDVDDVKSNVSDPIEGVNRKIYGFNHALDIAIFKPIAKGYRFIVPELARRGVKNVLTNLSEPVTFINAVLQGDVQHSFTTFWRFTLNSTFGIAGVFDMAKDAGLVHKKKDFGQTVGTYGAHQGPFLMLPILGPSNTRDTFGRIVDVFIDPFDYILNEDALIVRTAFVGLDARESTLDLTDYIDKTSLDPYASIRSLYSQKRYDEIKNANK